jgi:hypothetical protein
MCNEYLRLFHTQELLDLDCQVGCLCAAEKCSRAVRWKLLHSIKSSRLRNALKQCHCGSALTHSGNHGLELFVLAQPEPFGTRYAPAHPSLGACSSGLGVGIV